MKAGKTSPYRDRTVEENLEIFRKTCKKNGKKKTGKNSPYRDRSVEENLEIFRKIYKKNRKK